MKRIKIFHPKDIASVCFELIFRETVGLCRHRHDSEELSFCKRKFMFISIKIVTAGTGFIWGGLFVFTFCLITAPPFMKKRLGSGSGSGRLSKGGRNLKDVTYNIRQPFFKNILPNSTVCNTSVPQKHRPLHLC